jgi:methionyl-tRNA formyltransferase
VKPLRLAFLGTPDFAVPTLEALIGAGHEVACVYTQPARPAGRGQKPQPSPVERRAAGAGIPVRTPATLKAEEDRAAFRALGLDAAVVVAYGLILPRPILDAPRLGCFNVHASLLPRWRGAAPIQRAILEGDRETGVTIMRMEAGLDTGPMLLGEAVPIGPRTTTPELHDRLAALGARLILPALATIADGTAVETPQPAEGVTYAAKIGPEDGRLAWDDAVRVDRQVRALLPRPGAWFEHRGERIRVLDAEIVAGSGAPGTVLDERATVACGRGAIRLLRLQRPGRSTMDVAELLRGFPLAPGTVLGRA